MRRIMTLLVALCALAGCGTSGETTAETATSTASSTTSTSEATSMEEAPAATTTVAVATLYAEMDREIQRACSEAMATDRVPDPDFEDRWSDISSARKLVDTTQRCIDAKVKAAEPPPTTAPPTTAPPTTVAPQPLISPPSSTYYANCDAVRAAGAAPLYRGQPGYASHLDRDDDGVACEN